MKLRKGARLLALLAGLATLLIGSVPAAAQDTTCGGANHCYAIKRVTFPSQGAYQISSQQKWTCQAVVSKTADHSTATMWAFSSAYDAWVEFGITTGTLTQPGQSAQYVDRVWYEARGQILANGTLSYQEYLITTAAKPNRNQVYNTALRFDGAKWTPFVNNVAVGSLSSPLIGKIAAADAGAEITDSNVTNTGTFTNLGRQLWGASSTGGWTGTTTVRSSRDGVFTAATVTATGTSISFYNAEATAGCP